MPKISRKIISVVFIIMLIFSNFVFNNSLYADTNVEVSFDTDLILPFDNNLDLQQDTPLSNVLDESDIYLLGYLNGTDSLTGSEDWTWISEQNLFWSIDWFNFNDENSWWFRDITELWLNWWEIYLESIDWLWHSFTWTTFDNWYFSFDSVPIWSYKLCEVNQEWWIQTYPVTFVLNVIDWCFNFNVITNSILRFYFGNHYQGLIESTNIDSTTNTSSSSSESTSTGSTTNTGIVLIENTSTGSTESTSTSSSESTSTGSITNTGMVLIENTSTGSTTNINNVVSLWNRVSLWWWWWSWLASTTEKFIIVNENVEKSWLSEKKYINNLTINKLYNDYLNKLNRLEDIKKNWNNLMDQEKLLIELYIDWTYVSSKYKKQITKVIDRLNKLNTEKKQEKILKSFNRLEKLEQNYLNDLEIMNLISFLKLQLSIIHQN